MGNVNECCRCCYCCYYSHYSLTIELIQAWKRTGNDIRAWPEWEGAGPGQWYHSPSVQLSAGFRISGTLTRFHCMDMISGHQASGLLIHKTAATFPSLLALLFQNNTAFSFPAAFSTFVMQSWNSCAKLEYVGEGVSMMKFSECSLYFDIYSWSAQSIFSDFLTRLVFNRKIRKHFLSDAI